MYLTLENTENQINNLKETLSTLEVKHKSVKDMEKRLYAKNQEFEDLNKLFHRLF